MSACCGAHPQTQVLKPGRAPKTDSAEIAIFAKDEAPNREYEVLAKVSCREDPCGGAFASNVGADCLEEMKAEARRVGADALVDYENQHGAPGTVGRYNVTQQGFAVRWKPAASSRRPE